MNDAHLISGENIMNALPKVLKDDVGTKAIAETIAVELERMVQSTSVLQVYTAIDSMDEALLDILASDFKIDWWRSEATLQEKRNCLKNSWYVHKHLGTKSSIEKAISDFLGDGRVEEWFEYGGKPHHFRIKDANNSEIIANYSQFLAVLSVVQRGSAVLDHITALLTSTQTIHVGMCMRLRKQVTIGCEVVNVSDYNVLLDEYDNPLLMPDGGLIHL